MVATTACFGASQSGKWPAKFSIRMPVKRSSEPQIARCTITGCFFSPSRVDVERAEALRQVEVDLRGAALPVAPDRVAQHVFELRPVERAFAGIDAGLDAPAGLGRDPFEHAAHHALGVIPHRVGADALLRPGRELDHDVAR